jgi:hypothetical protein
MPVLAPVTMDVTAVRFDATSAVGTTVADAVMAPAK